MQWNEIAEALRTARGHDDGADVYVMDQDGDYVPISGVVVESIEGRSLIILQTDDDNYISVGTKVLEPSDNAAASELPDNRNVGDPAIALADDKPDDSNDSIPGATV